MKSPKFKSLLYIIIYLLFSIQPVLSSDEILTYNNIHVSLPNKYHCQPKTTVRLDSKNEEQFRKSRIDMQELSEMIKVYLWLDCKELETIIFEGFTEQDNKKVYHAVADKNSEWFLDEASIDKNKLNSKPNIDKNAANTQLKEENKKINQSKKETFSSLEELEKAAKMGSLEAMLTLAKGLLGISEVNSKINFKKDGYRGIKILEQLASKGNLNAMNALGQGYLINPALEMNFSLLEKLFNTKNNSGKTRGEIAAQLTLSSASKGGADAIKTLNKGGKAGSNISYYALGMMYLMDKQKKMPFDSDFLGNELGINNIVFGKGGKGNVDVGEHFLKLAAESGHKGSQEFLEDLDIKYDKEPSSSNKLQADIIKVNQAQQLSTDKVDKQSNIGNNAETKDIHRSLKQLLDSGMLVDILDKRKGGNAVKKLISTSTKTGSGFDKNNRGHGNTSNSRTNSFPQSNSNKMHKKRGNSQDEDMNTKQNTPLIID